jgi:hypothetical protein
MIKINVLPNCNNAPKKLFLGDFASAIANGESEFILQSLTNEFVWDIVGKSKTSGKENFINAHIECNLWKVKLLSIDTIITHGAEASITGRIQTENNTSFQFCQVFRFKSAGTSTINSI